MTAVTERTPIVGVINGDLIDYAGDFALVIDREYTQFNRRAKVKITLVTRDLVPHTVLYSRTAIVNRRIPDDQVA